MTIADDLSRALADTFTLAIKTQNYHWNVTGPQFAALHTAFEEQYDDLYEAADELAERIRAVGAIAPGGLEAFAKVTSVKEGNPNFTANEMVKDLAEDHRAVSKTMKELRARADEAEDPVTVAMYEDRMTVHDKTAWMLEAQVDAV